MAVNSIVFDYSKLRGKIREICSTETSFASMLGLSTVSLSAKLNNRTGFTESEILNSCDILGIDRNEIALYFFNRKTKKT